MRIRMRRYDSRSGFTLIELLAVIGIMCLLMVISIPVVSTVWRYAKNTATWAEMGGLANSIANYKLDQGALPGPLPDSAIYGYGTSSSGYNPSGPVLVSAGFLVNPPTSATLQATSSENLVLGLLGGLGINSRGAYYDGTLTGHPQILNAQTPQQKDVYYPMTKGDISDDGFGNYQSWTVGNVQPGFTAGQFTMPEFMDRFGNPHPIIYLRAKMGAPNVVDSPLGTTTDTSSQYYSAEMTPYGFTFPTPIDPNNNYTSLYPTGPLTPTGPPLFFQNPALGSQSIARGQDSYLLISAGQDGLYGTKDDLIWPKSQ